MIRFIMADLRRMSVGVMVVMLMVSAATALGMAVRMEERALRLGSARAADSFDMVIGAPGSETQLVLSTIFLQPSPLTLLPGEMLRRLSQDPRVEYAAPVGFGDSYYGRQIIGTTAEFVAKSGFELAEGTNFATPQDAVIGARIPMALGDEIKPQHGLTALPAEEHHDASYRVVGRLAPSHTPWDRAIMVPIEGVWHIHGLWNHDDHEEAAHFGPPWQADIPGVPAILIKPKTIANAYQLRGDYRNETSVAVFPAEVLTRLYATLGDARLALTAIAIGTQVLAMAAVILVTMAHLAQRKRQIGALRAFGAPRLAVFGIVGSELLRVIGSGVALGVGLGYLAARAMAMIFARQSGISLPVSVNGADIGFAGLLLTVAALIAVIPAIYAYRQSPAQALRG